VPSHWSDKQNAVQVAKQNFLLSDATAHDESFENTASSVSPSFARAAFAADGDRHPYQPDGDFDDDDDDDNNDCNSDNRGKAAASFPPGGAEDAVVPHRRAFETASHFARRLHGCDASNELKEQARRLIAVSHIADEQKAVNAATGAVALNNNLGRVDESTSDRYNHGDDDNNPVVVKLSPDDELLFASRDKHDARMRRRKVAHTASPAGAASPRLPVAIANILAPPSKFVPPMTATSTAAPQVILPTLFASVSASNSASSHSSSTLFKPACVVMTPRTPQPPRASPSAPLSPASIFACSRVAARAVTVPPSSTTLFSNPRRSESPIASPTALAPADESKALKAFQTSIDGNSSNDERRPRTVSRPKKKTTSKKKKKTASKKKKSASKAEKSTPQNVTSNDASHETATPMPQVPAAAVASTVSLPPTAVVSSSALPTNRHRRPQPLTPPPTAEQEAAAMRHRRVTHALARRHARRNAPSAGMPRSLLLAAAKMTSPPPASSLDTDVERAQRHAAAAALSVSLSFTTSDTSPSSLLSSASSSDLTSDTSPSSLLSSASSSGLTTSSKVPAVSAPLPLSTVADATGELEDALDADLAAIASTPAPSPAPLEIVYNNIVSIEGSIATTREHAAQKHSRQALPSPSPPFQRAGSWDVRTPRVTTTNDNGGDAFGAPQRWRRTRAPPRQCDIVGKLLRAAREKRSHAAATRATARRNNHFRKSGDSDSAAAASVTARPRTAPPARVSKAVITKTTTKRRDDGAIVTTSTTTSTRTTTTMTRPRHRSRSPIAKRIEMARRRPQTPPAWRPVSPPGHCSILSSAPPLAALPPPPETPALTKEERRRRRRAQPRRIEGKTVSVRDAEQRKKASKTAATAKVQRKPLYTPRTNADEKGDAVRVDASTVPWLVALGTARAPRRIKVSKISTKTTSASAVTTAAAADGNNGDDADAAAEKEARDERIGESVEATERRQRRRRIDAMTRQTVTSQRRCNR
jgi:hypothetical protein